MGNESSALPRILFIEQYAAITGGQRVLLSLLDGLASEYTLQVIVPARGTLSQELEKRGIPYRVFPIGYYSL